MARVGFGAMQLERLHDDADAAVRLLRTAVDGGVDHIDTAHFYGEGFVNDVIRQALTAGDEVAVVTKVGAESNPAGPIRLRSAQRPEELRAGVEANLRSLGVETLDVVNLRRLDLAPGLIAEGDQVIPLEEQLEVLGTMRTEGKLAAIGLSSVAAAQLKVALPIGVVCVQNLYNLLTREYEDLLTLCAAEEVAWVPFFPLGSAFSGFPNVADHPDVQEVAARIGALPTQVGLAWLLAHSPNTLLVPGTADPTHLADNLAAGQLQLSPADMATLDRLAAA